MTHITSKQCKSARSLLKWNVFDLVNKARGIPPHHIEQFEKGLCQLMGWENDEIVKTFKTAGILFTGDIDVKLDIASRQIDDARYTSGEGARIILDADQEVLADSSHVFFAEEEEDQGNVSEKNKKPRINK